MLKQNSINGRTLNVQTAIFKLFIVLPNERSVFYVQSRLESDHIKGRDR